MTTTTKETDSTTSNKNSYKKTKLGWIPEEWEVVTLGKIGQFLKGKGISKSELIDEGIPCLTYGELYTRHHDVIKTFNSMISRETANTSFKLEYGDILFSGSGEKLEDIGKSAAFVTREEAYAGGDIVILRQQNQNPIFLGYLTNSEQVRSQKYKMGQGHSVVHIYPSTLKNLQIPLPPLPEQEKIAQILSTWDDAIAKQTDLIAQKEALKKGLMQELLTGKKRLNGFTDKWKEVKLGEVAEFYNGKGHEGIVSQSGKYILVNSKFVSTSGNVVKHATEQLSPLYKNDIVMVMSDVPNGKAIAKCFIIDKDDTYTLNQRICALRVKKINHVFLYYQLNRNKNYLKYDDGLSQTNLKKKEVLNCPILVPAEEEQERIANILKAANSEIEKLKAQKSALETQKKGLMQVLLSGKVRIKH